MISRRPVNVLRRSICALACLTTKRPATLSPGPVIMASSLAKAGATISARLCWNSLTPTRPNRAKAPRIRTQRPEALAGVDLNFACTCNTLRGTLIGASPRSGNHAACYCHDCRSAEVFAGQPDPAPGPVGIFQTTPDKIRLDAGADQLAVFSFSDKGLLRWQARCCGALLFNTLRNPKIAFVGLRTIRLADEKPLGPIRTRGFIRKPNGKRGHRGLRHLLINMASNALAARLSGKWSRTPFFDPATGEPVRAIRVVNEAQRAALVLPKI